MKYLLFADLHLGLYNNSEIWHNIALNFIYEVRDYCIRNDIYEIFILGDFFDNRKEINTKTQNIAQDIAAILDDFKVNIIIGNHDIYYRNKIYPTSLRIFEKHKNINIIDKIVDYKNILLVPWLTNDVSRNFHTESQYCFGHFETAGFKMNDNYTCKKGEDINTFKQFKQVLSGHFHIPSNNGNMTYLGSPYPQNFNDINSNRGYYLWEDGNLIFNEFKKCPKFHYININSEDIVDKDIIEGNIIKLKFGKDFGTNTNEKIIETYKSYKPQDLSFDFSIIANEEDVGALDEDIGIIEHDKIIREFVSKTKVPENIDKKILMKIINNMVTKIKEK